MRKREKGFTLVEIIVVAAIIAVLAGILLPMIFNQVDEAKLARAEADVKALSTGVMVFRKDTGEWPSTSGEGCVALDLLYGDGNLLLDDLDVKGYDTDLREHFLNHLIDGNACYSNFHGPYINEVAADPWGNAYFINVGNFTGGGPVLIVSAGPDGEVDTLAADDQARDDDIAVRVK